MKIKLILLALIIVTIPISNSSSASQRPIVESFSFNPNDLDLISDKTTVTFELVVSHPNGIKNLTAQASLSGPNGTTLMVNLPRTDTPIKLTTQKVTFKGDLRLPQNIPSGAYSVSIAEIENNPISGYSFSTGIIGVNKLRNLIGAESSLLIRKSGDLNLDYQTFVGPSYNTTLGLSYKDPSIYNNENPPIWKVGEKFDPNKYYELRVPSLSLNVSTSTPLICISNGKQLEFISIGSCVFNVYTDKTQDYLAKESTQVQIIGAARIKPDLIVGKVATQTSKNIPKDVEIFRVFSPSGVYVLPKSITPSVCIASGFYVRIVGGGMCKLTYQSEANASYLASDLYTVSFEVTRDPQTLIFTTVSNVDISKKSITLSAIASSGAEVTFSTSTPLTCSVFGSTLNLLASGNCSITATQSGTATLAPISATNSIFIASPNIAYDKTIVCIKGKSSKKITGTKIKCPKGYRLKK